MHDSPRFRLGPISFIYGLIILHILSSHVFAAKRYQITRVNIQAQLHRDGSMVVIESRTYQFEGSFSYAFRVLPTDEVVTFRGFKIYENGQPYLLSDSKKPGTFLVSEEEKEVEVRWFFRARNESRTFDFHYRVPDAIKRYEDAAVLHFQFVSRDWTKIQKNIRLELIPPESLSRDQIKEWLHGPLWAESKIEEDGTIEAWCEHLPRHTYFDIRALYPPDIFLQANKTNERVREEIMAEEARWAEEANQQRELAIQNEATKQKRWALGKWIVFGITLAGFLGVGYFFMKFGRRPNLPPKVKFAADIPAKTPPALVGYLLNNRQIYGGALMGTLFDLAHKKFVALRQEEEERKSFLGGLKKKTSYFWDLDRTYWLSETDELKEYENELINFLFNELAGVQDSIDLKKIRKQQSKFTKFFKQWKKRVEKVGGEQEWFDKQSIRGMVYALCVTGGMFLVTIPAAIYFGPWAVILGFSAVALLLFSFVIPHRTREGETQARHWKALKRYLQKQHYRATDRSTLLNQISDYLIYGVVMGLNKKIFKELAGFVPSTDYNHYIPWYIYHGPGAGSLPPDAFAAAFSSMIATTTSTMSTASGAGGGASAGAGGASSGGGGAG